MELEPINYYYDLINRDAIIVKQKAPFFNWVNTVFTDDEPVTSNTENNVYLLREMDDIEKVRNWIKHNYNKIFVNELNDWCTDEASWPQKRTFKMFNEWFDVDVTSMVLDLEDFPVTKDL